MPTRPLPIVGSFALCREIFEDCRSHDFILVAPFSVLNVKSFPTTFKLSLYAHLADGHGSYQMGLQLRDEEGPTGWRYQWPNPIHFTSPVDPLRVVLYDAIVEFPRAGRYDLVLLADGEDLAHHAIRVRAYQPPGQKG